MKCGEPNPGKTYADCDLELKHRGDHSYLGQRWPRVQPAEPDLDVDVLLSRAAREAGVWGVEERSFPIIVTETVTRVLWVVAETEDQALAYWGEGGDYPRLDDTEVLDGCLEFERPDQWQRQSAFRANRFEQKIGPLVPCPDCGAEAFRREWIHNPMRKCHGPIQWRLGGHGKLMREYRSTPMHDAAPTAVTA